MESMQPGRWQFACFVHVLPSSCSGNMQSNNSGACGYPCGCASWHKRMDYYLIFHVHIIPLPVTVRRGHEKRLAGPAAMPNRQWALKADADRTRWLMKPIVIVKAM
eukprot:scaffold171982_cov20-Prasinocladus_malaysianus.AAC.1